MIALNLISNHIPPLKPTDTVASAGVLMLDFKVNQLPMVSSDLTFLGLISDDDLIKISAKDTLLETLIKPNYTHFVYQQQHIYDVIKTVYELQLSLVPVLNDTHKYLGLISLNTLLENIASLLSLPEKGAIIVLELNANDNSLAFIAQIIESQDSKILSASTRYLPLSTQVEITLKINKTDISQILAALNQHKIDVKKAFNHQNNYNNLADRYQSLMNYLSF
ncbi:MAG: CBS domain-containing protein [Sphingobacteriales bacterium]|nr:MAG: CBS domain-containing protein [Sphingobacteriales bacterium]TAF82699.1 MAG: CBS domain-containing protein [Sphingobacteriales bacterium]